MTPCDGRAYRDGLYDPEPHVLVKPGLNVLLQVDGDRDGGVVCVRVDHMAEGWA